MNSLILVVSLVVLFLVSCNKQNPQIPSNLDPAAKPLDSNENMKGEKFRNRSNSISINFIGADECEIREVNITLIAKYSVSDKKIRIVLSNSEVIYFVNTKLGLKPEKGRQGYSDPELVDIKRFQELEDAAVNAEKGNVAAQIFLGRAFGKYGGLVEWSAVNSQKWFEKAVAQGSVDAEVELADEMLNLLGGFRGYSMETDPYRAARITWHLQNASAKGSARAWKLLGEMHTEGVYTPGKMLSIGIFPVSKDKPTKNFIEAYKCYFKAFELSNGHLCGWEIAGARFDGQGVPLDQASAFVFYSKEAMAGEGLAQAMMVHCYSSGKGVQKDLIQAAAWWQIVSENKFNDAFFDHRLRDSVDLSQVRGDFSPEDAAKISRCKELLRTQIKVRHQPP